MKSVNICLKGQYTTGARFCNSVRVTIDITDSWDNIYKVIDFYGTNKGNFAELAGPGYWNDADEVLIHSKGRIGGF